MLSSCCLSVVFDVQGSRSFLRLHVNGEIVGEKSLTAFHNNELHADFMERKVLPFIVGDNHRLQVYVYHAEFSSSTLPIKTHYLKV